MELSVLKAAFFRRFRASIHETMREEDMHMYDAFSASPTEAKLVLKLQEKAV